MTEVEWLACDDPRDMIYAVMARASGRKLRLHAVACCRRLVSFLGDQQSAAEGRLLVAERFADGEVPLSELRKAQSLFLCGGGISLHDFGHDAVKDEPDAAATFSQMRCWIAAQSGLMQPRATRLGFFARLVQRLRPQAPQERPSGERSEARQERGAQCALVRDIFGNPFAPVAFDPAWRIDTAVTVARQMYDSREFGAMPILADALQDAGCEDEVILAHCRAANQVHVRGCWVCDLVLNKN